MNIPYGNGNNAQARAIRSSIRAFLRAWGIDVGALIKMLDKYIKNPSLLDAKPEEKPAKPIIQSEPRKVDDIQFWMTDEYKAQEKERERRIKEAFSKDINNQDCNGDKIRQDG